MKKHKGSIEAYFTVEASLVMPVVIGSVIFVICFLLYWYNRCLMEQDLSVMAVKASQSEAKTGSGGQMHQARRRRSILRPF